MIQHVILEKLFLPQAPRALPAIAQPDNPTAAIQCISGKKQRAGIRGAAGHLTEPVNPVQKNEQLLAQTEPVDEGTVTVHALPLQIIQQLAALAHQTQQAATGVMILDMVFEMLGKIVDTRGHQRDLHFRGPGITALRLKILHDFGLLRARYCHVYFSMIKLKYFTLY
jgi:hypothetical protein